MAVEGIGIWMGSLISQFACKFFLKKCENIRKEVHDSSVGPESNFHRRLREAEKGNIDANYLFSSLSFWIDFRSCSIRLWSIGRWYNSVRSGWHRISCWWHSAGESDRIWVSMSIFTLNYSLRSSARTTITGGKLGTILLAVRRAWFHHLNFKNGAQHASQPINPNRNKVRYTIPTKHSCSCHVQNTKSKLYLNTLKYLFHLVVEFNFSVDFARLNNNQFSFTVIDVNIFPVQLDFSFLREKEIFLFFHFFYISYQPSTTFRSVFVFILWRKFSRSMFICLMFADKKEMVMSLWGIGFLIHDSSVKLKMSKDGEGRYRWTFYHDKSDNVALEQKRNCRSQIVVYVFMEFLAEENYKQARANAITLHSTATILKSL